MEIYYKNKLLFSNIEKEKINEIIENYISEKKEKYEKIYKRTKNILKEIENIRPLELGETNEEYFTFLITNYSEILKEIETIGKELYKESFIDIFFENSKNELIGITIYNENKIKEKIYLNPLLLKISMEIPLKKNFEIKEEL